MKVRRDRFAACKPVISSGKMESRTSRSSFCSSIPILHYPRTQETLMESAPATESMLPMTGADVVRVFSCAYSALDVEKMVLSVNDCRFNRGRGWLVK